MAAVSAASASGSPCTSASSAASRKTKADSAKFWALYDAYENSRKEIGKKRIANIEEYSKNYDKLTNENTGALLNKSFEVYNDFGKLWQNTYKKMAKEISPLTAGKFIQVEMYLENLVRNELSAEIPLLEQLTSVVPVARLRYRRVLGELRAVAEALVADAARSCALP